MTNYLAQVEQCEQLYAAVCMDPPAWSDTALADWIEGITATAPPEKEVGREIRRVVRMAAKLRDFWAEPRPGMPPDYDDWRTKVDIALGPRAWRPLLNISSHGLEQDPSAELFEDVRERFRVVAGEHWMEGLSFEDWLDQTQRN